MASLAAAKDSPDYWERTIEKMERGNDSKLHVTVVGGGIGGLGATIGCLLAGHDVDVLEAADQFGEIGAGIQLLPNGSRILYRWGLREIVRKLAIRPGKVNMWGWKGNLISSLDYHDAAAQYPGSDFLDFHRPVLHKILLDRAIELGAKLHNSCRVVDVQCHADGSGANVVLADGSVRATDLVVGADGVFGNLREIMLKRPDPPIRSGDMAYRITLPAAKLLDDPELAVFIKEPQVNYWLGPDAHCVNYVLRGGELFNFPLALKDDIPLDQPNRVPGDVNVMREYFKDWEPRITKLLSKCESVEKWRLCYRLGLDSWNDPSGSFTMLGDAVHATVPYFASGAGICLEDGAVLGECLSRIKSKSPTEKQHALAVYESCRKDRAVMLVRRGNVQQVLYHFPDGPEQMERDEKMRMQPPPPGEAIAWRDPGFAPQLFSYDHIQEVELRWSKATTESLNREPQDSKL